MEHTEHMHVTAAELAAVRQQMDYTVDIAAVDALTVAQVEGILEGWISGDCDDDCDDDCDCGQGSWGELGETHPWPRLPNQPKGTFIKGLGFVECVEDFGGEGEGDRRWKVWRIGSRLFRKDGWYASHYGSSFDGQFREVTAQQRLVTVYE